MRFCRLPLSSSASFACLQTAHPVTESLPSVNVHVPPRLMLVAAPCLWSLGGALIKSIDLDPVSITFYRSVFTALVLLPFLKGRTAMPHPLVAVSIPAYAATTTCFIIATKITTAANASLLLYTAPVYVFVLSALFLKEIPDRRSLVALCCGLTGMAVIFYGGMEDRHIPGVMYGIASGVAFAVYTILIRRLRAFHPVFLAILHHAGMAAILAVAASPDWNVAGHQLAALAGMAAVQLALPSVLYIAALRHVPAHEASVIILIEPVLNILLVASFIGEIPSAATVAGGALILGGLLFRYLPVASSARRDP